MLDSRQCRFVGCLPCTIQGPLGSRDGAAFRRRPPSVPQEERGPATAGRPRAAHHRRRVRGHGLFVSRLLAMFGCDFVSGCWSPLCLIVLIDLNRSVCTHNTHRVVRGRMTRFAPPRHLLVGVSPGFPTYIHVMLHVTIFPQRVSSGDRHGKDTVHGDLKSANVLLDGAGRAKVNVCS